jgi:periplasmic divalent cation tolerance protein
VTGDCLLVLSTCPSLEAASALARQLLEQDRAACVNVVPAVRSMYLWQGAVQTDDEALMIIKTTASRFDRLRETLVANHPYEVPEVVAIRIADGHHPYLDWLAHPGGPASDPDA